MTKQNYCFFSDIQIESFKKIKSPAIFISEIPKSPAIFIPEIPKSPAIFILETPKYPGIFRDYY